MVYITPTVHLTVIETIHVYLNSNRDTNVHLNYNRDNIQCTNVPSQYLVQFILKVIVKVQLSQFRTIIHMYWTYLNFWDNTCTSSRQVWWCIISVISSIHLNSDADSTCSSNCTCSLTVIYMNIYIYTIHNLNGIWEIYIITVIKWTIQIMKLS